MWSGGEPGREDEQVRGEERAEAAVHEIIHPGLIHGPEEDVGVEETGGVPGYDVCVAEGLSQRAFALSLRTRL